MPFLRIFDFSRAARIAAAGFFSGLLGWAVVLCGVSAQGRVPPRCRVFARAPSFRIERLWASEGMAEFAITGSGLGEPGEEPERWLESRWISGYRYGDLPSIVDHLLPVWFDPSFYRHRRVLLYGASNAFLMQEMLAAGMDVYGVDYDVEAPPANSPLASRLIAANLRHLPFPDKSFEVVIAPFSLRLEGLRERLLELRRVLSYGGVVRFGPFRESSVERAQAMEDEVRAIVHTMNDTRVTMAAPAQAGDARARIFEVQWGTGLR